MYIFLRHMLSKARSNTYNTYKQTTRKTRTKTF